MYRSLPKSPSLDQLRKQAKNLLKACPSASPEIIARIQEWHPAYKNAWATGINSGSFSLRDAQLVIAREYNFENWARLREYFDWDLAVLDHDLVKMESLLKAKPSRSGQAVTVFRRNNSYWTMVPMHFANNNIPMVKLLLKYGAKPDTRGESVLSGHSTPEFIDFVLQQGVNLENQYYNGTVLSLAAYVGNAQAVQHYILRGADVNSRCETEILDNWETPLHRATFCNPRLRGHDRDEWAEDRDYLSVVRLLLDAGADVNAKTNVDTPSDMGPGLIAQGQTPLHFAAASGEFEIMQLLLGAGADKYAETALGETPLDYATKHRWSAEIVELLT